MTRSSGDAIPVMDDAVRTATGVERRVGGRDRGQSANNSTKSGASGASRSTASPRTAARAGAHVRAPLDAAGRPPLRRDHLGVPHREHRERERQDRLRAEGRRGPGVLEPARHQRRRQQVLPRPRRHARARAQRPAADRPRRQHDRRLGRDPALLRHGRGPARLPGRAHAPARPPEDGVQLAGLVQRRQSKSARSASACFINSVQDNMGSIMDLAKTEAMLFKYGSGAGVEPVHDPLEPGAHVGRRHRVAARSASCAATTRSPASSSRAARPAARRRWSSSTPTIRTSSTSSTPRRTRSRRPGR